MLAHQPSSIMRTRHKASAHGHAHSRAHAAARLPVSGRWNRIQLTSYNGVKGLKQEASENPEPNEWSLQSASDASEEKKVSSVSHRFLTRGGGVPMGTVHKGPCCMQRHTTTTKKIDPNSPLYW